MDIPKPSSAYKPLNDIEVLFPPQTVRIDFIFSEHNKPQSLPVEFGSLALQSDIVALEAVGWSTEGARLRQSIADGDTQALKEISLLLPLTPQGGFWRRLHKGLFDTKVEVHHPEAPQFHPIADAHVDATAEEDQIVSTYKKLVSGGEVQSRILLPMLHRTMATIVDRDRYTLEHFFPEQALRGNLEVRLLAVFGLAHRVLAPVIARQAKLQGRSDITIRTIESGNADVSSYEKYLRGDKLSEQDVTAYYDYGPVSFNH